jgi:hypothetical protein
MHCLWYKNGYTPGSKEKPDAVWMDGEKLPAHVPENVLREKVMNNGRLVWQYQRKFRAVVMLYNHNTGIIEDVTPYGMDIASASIFGEASNSAMSFKGLLECIAGLNQRLKKQGRPKIYPNMFPVRVTFTPESIPVLQFTPLTDSVDGKTVLRWLPPEEHELVCQTLLDPTVLKMLDPRRTEALEGEDGSQVDVSKDENSATTAPPPATKAEVKAKKAPVQTVTDDDLPSKPLNVAAAAAEAAKQKLNSRAKTKEPLVAGTEEEAYLEGLLEL